MKGTQVHYLVLILAIYAVTGNTLLPGVFQLGSGAESLDPRDFGFAYPSLASTLSMYALVVSLVAASLWISLVYWQKRSHYLPLLYEYAVSLGETPPQKIANKTFKDRYGMKRRKKILKNNSSYGTGFFLKTSIFIMSFIEGEAFLP